MGGDHMTFQYKFGKQPARYDARTLRLADYLEDLPAPMPSVNNARRVRDWPMYSNDTLNDCTCAAAGHLIQDWTAIAHREVTPTESQIVEAYEAVAGYRPGDPSTDKGATKIAVLNYWRRKGIAGHTIWAYVAIEPGNHDQVKDTVQYFGGAYIGLKLPISAQYQLRDPLNLTVWSVPSGGPVGQGLPGSWEGHSVPVVAYDHRTLTVVSWGDLLKITWQFFDVYCDEAYAILAHEWIDAKGGLPRGFRKVQLLSDLEDVEDHLPA